MTEYISTDRLITYARERVQTCYRSGRVGMARQLPHVALAPDTNQMIYPRTVDYG